MTKKFQFFNTDFLRSDEIYLKLYTAADANEKKGLCPVYFFYICLHDGTVVGRCDLRIGHNERLFYGGNIGYSVEKKYRGNHYAGKACFLLFELAKKHDLGYVIITCNPDNFPSRKTCEYVGGEFIDIVNLPHDNDMFIERGETQKCIFKVTL